MPQGWVLQRKSAPSATNKRDPAALRILLTGCAGVIGAQVASLLLDGGHDVAGIDSLRSNPTQQSKAGEAVSQHDQLDLDAFQPGQSKPGITRMDRPGLYGLSRSPSGCGTDCHHNSSG